jgi:hypothetical protein
MKSWGRYQIVSTPADAELVFEISFSVSLATGGCDAKFHLVVLDPKTHVTLWAFTEYVDNAILGSNREKHFEQGMESVVADANPWPLSLPLRPRRIKFAARAIDLRDSGSDRYRKAVARSRDGYIFPRDVDCSAGLYHHELHIASQRTRGRLSIPLRVDRDGVCSAVLAREQTDGA